MIHTILNLSCRLPFVPADSTSFWTMLAAAGSFVVAAVAWRGLRSLSLAKADMLNRAQRSSVHAAVERCEEMARILLPMHHEVLAEFVVRQVPVFASAVADVSFEAHEETGKIDAAVAWVSALDPVLQRKIIGLLNAMEVWSMHFTLGLADRNVAFDPCSSVYCQMVMQLYPALLTQRRADPVSGPFQNVVLLFRDWYSTKAKAQLLKDLQRHQTRGPSLPPPIGTVLDR